MDVESLRRSGMLVASCSEHLAVHASSADLQASFRNLAADLRAWLSVHPEAGKRKLQQQLRMQHAALAPLLILFD